MTDASNPAAPDLPAGRFGPWLAATQRVLRGEAEADVPCDGCTACCTSSQFVHIGRDELDALRHIPASLVFPAPGTDDELLLGYDEHGHCPMLGASGCSIYEHRPRTCRTYDCRVFAAAGVEVTDDAQAGIGARARRWRFDVATEEERTELAALRAAAVALRDEGGPAMSPAQVAVVAIRRRAQVGSSAAANTAATSPL